MLAPMAPHIGEELWQILGHTRGLKSVRWPEYRADLAKEDEFEVVIQINGRVRGKMVVEGGLDENALVERALREPQVAAHIDGKRVVKRIVVPNKLVNLVIA
jgi:leucyl-tRNA synthetase